MVGQGRHKGDAMANEYNYVFNKLINGETIKLVNHIDIWDKKTGEHHAVFDDDPDREAWREKLLRDCKRKRRRYRVGGIRF